MSPDLILELREAAKRVLAGEIPGVECEMHGRKIVRYDVGVAGFLCEAWFWDLQGNFTGRFIIALFIGRGWMKRRKKKLTTELLDKGYVLW